MTDKKFILNADDFGLSNEINKAVEDGYNNEMLYSASLCANGEAFDSAVNEILPKSPKLCVGVHLNIIEGKALNSDLTLLTDKDGNFCNGYIKLLALSNNKQFLNEVEKEFRTQIEKVLKSVPNVAHIDSHVHTHSIPNIFKITCKLAKEYNIPYVRTQFECPYITPKIAKHLNFKYPVNLIKVVLLNSFTILNRKVVEEYGLKTNDYLIGVAYTSMMDSMTLESGLKSLKNTKDVVVESLIHPFCSMDKESSEYEILKNLALKDEYNKLGFELTSYKELCK